MDAQTNKLEVYIDEDGDSLLDSLLAQAQCENENEDNLLDSLLAQAQCENFQIGSNNANLTPELATAPTPPVGSLLGGSSSSTQGQVMTQVGYLNQTSTMQNGNSFGLQGIGVYDKQTSSNPMLSQNTIQNNNFISGYKNQLAPCPTSFYPRLDQPSSSNAYSTQYAPNYTTLSQFSSTLSSEIGHSPKVLQSQIAVGLSKSSQFYTTLPSEVGHVPVIQFQNSLVPPRSNLYSGGQSLFLSNQQNTPQESYRTMLARPMTSSASSPASQQSYRNMLVGSTTSSTSSPISQQSYKTTLVTPTTSSASSPANQQSYAMLPESIASFASSHTNQQSYRGMLVVPTTFSASSPASQQSYTTMLAAASSASSSTSQQSYRTMLVAPTTSSASSHASHQSYITTLAESITSSASLPTGQQVYRTMLAAPTTSTTSSPAGQENYRTMLAGLAASSASSPRNQQIRSLHSEGLRFNVQQVATESTNEVLSQHGRKIILESSTRAPSEQTVTQNALSSTSQQNKRGIEGEEVPDKRRRPGRPPKYHYQLLIEQMSDQPRYRDSPVRQHIQLQILPPQPKPKVVPITRQTPGQSSKRRGRPPKKQNQSMSQNEKVSSETGKDDASTSTTQEASRVSQNVENTDEDGPIEYVNAVYDLAFERSGKFIDLALRLRKTPPPSRSPSPPPKN